MHPTARAEGGTAAGGVMTTLQEVWKKTPRPTRAQHVGFAELPVSPRTSW